MNSSLNPIAFAMRHPVSVMAGVAALAVASLLAARRMAVDVFPALDLSVIYIAQPYGGMDPSQMESQITCYYEAHSIYMTGIHHVESKFKTSDAAVSEAVAGVALAEATLVESKAQRDKAAADIRVAEARLRVAKADRDRAAAVLGYTRIEAPYDGVVSRRELDTGAYVQPPAGDPSSATPLFEVVQTHLMRIFVDVPEADAPLVRDGGPARVQVQALGDRELPGRVARSSWALDNRTRTLRAEIDLPNPEGILRSGMYATARIPVSRPQTLTLPASSVFLQDDQAWVVRLVGNKAVRTPVRLGLRERQRVEVLRKQTRPTGQGVPAEWEDFTDSDMVVADNPTSLHDGQEITIRPEDPSVASLSLAAEGKSAPPHP